MIALALTILVAWTLVAFAGALLVGPLLKDRASLYPPVGDV